MQGDKKIVTQKFYGQAEHLLAKSVASHPASFRSLVSKAYKSATQGCSIEILLLGT